VARSPDHGAEQEAVIAERDAPLIRHVVVDSIRVCGRIFEQVGQASIDEVTDIVGKVAVLLLGDLQPDWPVARHPGVPVAGATG